MYYRTVNCNVHRHEVENLCFNNISGVSEPIKQLTGHTEGVTCLSTGWNGTVLSGSADCTVRVGTDRQTHKHRHTHTRTDTNTDATHTHP